MLQLFDYKYKIVAHIGKSEKKSPCPKTYGAYYTLYRAVQ